MRTPVIGTLTLALALLSGTPGAWAQVSTTTTTTTTTTVRQPVVPPDRVVIFPQSHRVPQRWRAVAISAVGADITITDQLATTTLEISVTNPGGAPQEAELLLPVPDGVTVRSLQYDGTGPEPTAQLLPKDEARRIYDSIVRGSRDPALLEFAGLNVIRSSAFPVPAGATQKIRITFEQLLTSDAGRIEYVLPKTESLATAATVPWTIKATIKSAKPVSTVYSPTHDLTTERRAAGEFAVTVPAQSASGPGTFRLCAVTPQDATAASAALYAYPDATIGGGKGGYFLLFAALPTEKPADRKPVPREITIVLDRSGSMQGEKFDQAKSAAINILRGMTAGERFNIVDYADTVETFAKDAVLLDDKSRTEGVTYLERLRPTSGTNINDALLTALAPKPAPGHLPLVLFLTDGLPTVGERSEVAIRNNAAAANTSNRRIFTFGVGFDVNTPLLAGLSRAAKGAPTFVLPKEDIEVKVGQVYRRLNGPTFANASMTFLDADGKPSTRIVRELQPTGLDDVYEGDQIVVVGQYTGETDTLKVTLGGEYFGTPKTFDLSMKLDASSAKHGFVPRLWATRKVAMLVDEVRQISAEPASATREARTKELVDQITALSTRWGVMTPYTSFLATETNLAIASPALLQERVRETYSRAAGQRSGEGGVMQEADSNAKGKALNVQRSNTVVATKAAADAAGAAGRPAAAAYSTGPGDNAAVQIAHATVQNINAQTYYFRQNRWVDGRLIGKESDKPEVEVAIGSPEFAPIADALIADGQTGLLTLEGDILTVVNGKVTLIKPCTEAKPETKDEKPGAKPDTK